MDCDRGSALALADALALVADPFVIACQRAPRDAATTGLSGNTVRVSELRAAFAPSRCLDHVPDRRDDRRRVGLMAVVIRAADDALTTQR